MLVRFLVSNTRLTGGVRSSLLGVLGLLLSLPAADRVQGQDLPPDQLYNARWGCGGCHGGVAEGGMGPALKDTSLTLRHFLRQVRAPMQSMPRFSPLIASDAKLAEVYAWLGGSEELAAPLPLILEVKGFGRAAEGSFAARAADGSPRPADTPVRYRLLLEGNEGFPVAGHAIAVRVAGDAEWSEVTTDDRGEAWVGPGRLTLADLASGRQGTPLEVRVTGLPTGSYGIVVEAVDSSKPAEPAVLGVGSAVLTIT